MEEPHTPDAPSTDASAPPLDDNSNSSKSKEEVLFSIIKGSTVSVTKDYGNKFCIRFAPAKDKEKIKQRQAEQKSKEKQEAKRKKEEERMAAKEAKAREREELRNAKKRKNRKSDIIEEEEEEEGEQMNTAEVNDGGSGDTPVVSVENEDEKEEEVTEKRKRKKSKKEKKNKKEKKSKKDKKKSKKRKKDKSTSDFYTDTDVDDVEGSSESGNKPPVITIEEESSSAKIDDNDLMGDFSGDELPKKEETKKATVTGRKRMIIDDDDEEDEKKIEETPVVVIVPEKIPDQTQQSKDANLPWDNWGEGSEERTCRDERLEAEGYIDEVENEVPEKNEEEEEQQPPEEEELLLLQQQLLQEQQQQQQQEEQQQQPEKEKSNDNNNKIGDNSNKNWKEVDLFDIFNPPEEITLYGELCRLITSPIKEFTIRIEAPSWHKPSSLCFKLVSILDVRNREEITYNNLKKYSRATTYFDRVAAASSKISAQFSEGRRRDSAFDESFKSLKVKMAGALAVPIKREASFGYVNYSIEAAYVIKDLFKGIDYFSAASTFGTKVASSLTDEEVKLIWVEINDENVETKTQLFKKICMNTDRKIAKEDCMHFIHDSEPRRNNSNNNDGDDNSYIKDKTSALRLVAERKGLLKKKGDGDNLVDDEAMDDDSLGVEAEAEEEEEREEVNTNNKKEIELTYSAFEMARRLEMNEKYFKSSCIFEPKDYKWDPKVIDILEREWSMKALTISMDNSSSGNNNSSSDQNAPFLLKAIMRKSIWNDQKDTAESVISGFKKLTLINVTVDDEDITGRGYFFKLKSLLSDVLTDLNEGESGNGIVSGPKSHVILSSSKNRYYLLKSKISGGVPSNSKDRIITTHEKIASTIAEIIKGETLRSRSFSSKYTPLNSNNNDPPRKPRIALIIDRCHLFDIGSFCRLLQNIKADVSHLYLIGNKVGSPGGVGAPFQDLWKCSTTLFEKMKWNEMTEDYIRSDKLKGWVQTVDHFVSNSKGIREVNTTNQEWSLVVKSKKNFNMVSSLFDSKRPDNKRKDYNNQVPVLEAFGKVGAVKLILLQDVTPDTHFFQNLAILTEGMNIYDIQFCLDCSSSSPNSVVLIGSRNSDIREIHKATKKDGRRRSCFDTIFKEVYSQSVKIPSYNFFDFLDEEKKV